MLIQRRKIGAGLLILPVLALFYLGLWLAIKIKYPHGLDKQSLSVHYSHFSIIYIFWLLTFLSFRLFDRETFRRKASIVFTLFSAMLVNLLIAIAYFYIQPNLILTPRRFLLVHIAISFVLILLWDLFLQAAIFKRLVQPVYLFSFNDELKGLEDEIRSHDYLGFKVVGHINEGDLKNLSSSTVVFPDNLHTNKELAQTIFDARNSGLEFYNHNYFYERLLRRIYTPSLNQIWFLQNITYSRKILYIIAKRVFDFVLGLVVFVLFAATYPILALFIKLTSAEGSVLFKQERVGEQGKIFTIYKYRTMRGQSSNQWTAKNDERITAFGKFLRISRLDELPQSINLLKGDMSIVGPRPEQVGIVENLKQAIPFYEERHVVKPGITGWAQLNVYAASLEESRIKLEYDLYYIKHQSFLFDLEIIAKTAFNILALKGQ